MKFLFDVWYNGTWQETIERDIPESEGDKVEDLKYKALRDVEDIVMNERIEIKDSVTGEKF